MMGARQQAQGALFYEFSLEDYVPGDHLLRLNDRFVDLSGIRGHLAPFYSSTGRPSVDPELMIRILLIGYVMGIRSERRLCEEVHLNLAYRWFCRLDLTDAVPDHSTFSKNRHGRFRESDLFRQLFETGAAGDVKPKFTSHSDPAAQWTGAHKGPAFFAYADNYLIDTEHAVIVDVEATRAIRQAEVGAARTMIERTLARFGLYPEALVADTAYGSAVMLGWLVYEHGIEPHITVFDKSKRRDGCFEKADFTYDHQADAYTCPAGKQLRPRRRACQRQSPLADADGMVRYRASKLDCEQCTLTWQCCPKAPARKILRSVYEVARDMARDEFHLAATAQNLRKLAKLVPHPQPMPG